MLSAAYETPTAHPDCTRVQPRTNMFVMAKLAAGRNYCAVKVRNMSTSGALIEGADLPQPGISCRLVRGETSLEADIVWSQAGKAGLRFRNPAQVETWLPSGRRSQSDVSRAVAPTKAELASTRVERPPAPLISARLTASEVASTADMLEVLADELAEDPVVVSRFLAKLQTLDIAVQTLRKLANSKQYS